MEQSTPSARAVFDHAVEIESPAEREAYVAGACGENPELRKKVDALMRAHAAAESFLESPAGDLGLGLTAGPRAPMCEGVGTMIGAYKLLQQIGEGGMGVVFLAEQTSPVKRKVALKIIKAGMDTRQVLARFEAERQALAMMDHVNIARVLDVGSTEGGRPYFVMELVHGVPITKFCDDNRLSPRERLELFVPVCQAIQHAHQKGIIHRDVKPTNVMVTLYDGKPVPKVIDFGVAKATEQRLTERTLFTQYGTMVGTFEYMSPEQAEMSALGADTRSDIFSLGVLLYELLTGSTPLTHKRLKEAAYGEVLRMIREEEAPRPSTRLSDSGQALASISAQRHMEPAKLTKLVRGELDWIVMKTLEKDRSRRYETVSALAADVRRYLDDEAVQACPPSAVYALRKFARRHRRPLVAALLIFSTLVCGMAVSTWQAVRATRAEQQAVRERDAKEAARREAVANARHARAVSDFLVNAFRSTSPLRHGRAVTIADVLDRAANQLQEKVSDDPLTEGALLHAIGESYRALALYEEAIVQLEKAREGRVRTLGRQHTETVRCVRDLGWAYIVADRPNQALPLFEENLRIAKAGHGLKNPIILQCAYDLAVCYFELGRKTDSLKLVEETFALQETTLGRNHPDTVESMFELARNYGWAGRSDEAAKLYQNVIKLAAEHPDPTVRLLEMEAKEGLARLYAKSSRFEEAQPLIEESVKLFERWLGPEHRGTHNAREGLGSIYADLGRTLTNADDIQKRNPTRALRLATKAVAIDPHPSRALQSLGWAEYRMGHWQASVDALQKSCELGRDGAGSAFQWFFLAMAHWQLGEQDKARRWYGKAVEWMEKQQTDDEQLRRLRAEAQELLKITDGTKAKPSVEVK